MTLSIEHQETLQVIKNIAHARRIIYTEYRKILDQGEAEAKKLIDEIFTLTVNLSDLSDGVKDGYGDTISLHASFTVDSLKKFLYLCVTGYDKIIQEINELDVFIQEGIAADKLELKLMLLANIIKDFADANERDIEIFKNTYYSEQQKPMFNRFFNKAPSNKTFSNFFSDCVNFLDIGANYFTHMYDLMSDTKMLTPEFIRMKSEPNIRPAMIVNASNAKLSTKLQDYANLLYQNCDKIFCEENRCFITEADISEFADLFCFSDQIIEEDRLLCKEYTALARLTDAYPSSKQNGIVVANAAVTSGQIFNVNYKSLMIARKFTDLFEKIEEEMQHSKSIFVKVANRLQNARKESQAPAPNLGNEETDPQIPVADIDQLLKQQIADKNLKAKQNKEAEKAQAVERYKQQLVWSQQQLASLDVAGAEPEPIKLHELSREDYATLTALFSKDRSKIDFKTEQLMSLAEHCGADCSETKSGFKVKFGKSLAFISEPTAVKVSKSASSTQTAPTDDPMLTFHRQHRTDRNVDAGIVAAFKAALEKAGFTPETCTIRTSNSPRLDVGSH